MKLVYSLLAAALLVAPGTAIAQNAPAETSGSAAENPSAIPQSSHTGTTPEGMGSTGWSGPHRGQTEKDKSHDAGDRAAATSQPYMATGEDLKGPPTQFAPAKTPE